MRIIECKQGSTEWLQARLGIPCASEFKNLITPLGKVKTGDGPETYCRRKVTEKWLGRPLESYCSRPMVNGKTREEHARDWYALEYGVKVQEVGFITTDDGRWGCSPDGLLGAKKGLEIKSPEIETQIGWLLDGVLPPEHVAQVQGSMLICEADSWHFLARCPGAPEMELDVARDDEFCDNLKKALDAACNRINSEYKQLCFLNGGEPFRQSEQGLAEADRAAGLRPYNE
jgi:hypothetical protein